MLKKPFLFITDFDGTATQKDVYLLFLEKYHKQQSINEIETKNINNKLNAFQYLNAVFNNVGKTENEILEDLKSIALDEHFKKFVTFLSNNNCDLVIVSAGGSCYIEKILANNNLSHIPFHANDSKFINGGVEIYYNTNSTFHSEKFGIDKEKVVFHYRVKYQTIFFAGDSSPDYHAGLASDYRFAKGLLKKYYETSGIDYFPFDTFYDIQHIFEKKKFLSDI